MCEVACTVLPLKTSSELDFAKKAVQFGKLKKWDVKVLDKMTKRRNAMLKAFMERREVEKTVEDYLVYLAAMVEGGQAAFLKKMLFYYWGTAVGRRTSHAAADAHYELASVLSNVGLYEMSVVAQSVHLANRSSVERLEKEGYKTLCTAAGRFDKAHSLMAGFPSVDDAFPLDIKPSMLGGFRDLCLAQAQELSLSKAMRNSDNRGRELLAKLASRAYDLYSSALTAFQEQKPAPEDPLYLTLVASTLIKKHALQARAFLLMTAYFSTAKVNKMPEAISACSQAEATVAKLNTELATHKKKLDKQLITSMECVDQECQRMTYKVRRDIQVIGRPKEMDAPVPMVEPQELARAVPYACPEMHADWTPEVIQTFELKD